MTRRIFIGDIQGCREELEQLLERLAFDPATDRLLPVGDLVNRGPDSLGVLRLLSELGAEPVLGNHDLHLLGCADGTRSLRGRDTLDAVLKSDDRDTLLDWLRAQPFVRVFPDLYLVHAGLHPKWRAPLEELAHENATSPGEAARFAVRVRHCAENGELPPALGSPTADPPGPYRPWFEHYRPEAHDGRTVVFGHWAVRGLVREAFLRGLDTGCVWGKRLTAWIAEEDRLVDVPAARCYSPFEEG